VRGSCDAVAVGRGLIADPFLYAHLRDGAEAPRCAECNACVGCIGVLPVDCYHPDVRALKDALLVARDEKGSIGPHAFDRPRPVRCRSNGRPLMS
jgi:hypothetical protein